MKSHIMTTNQRPTKKRRRNASRGVASRQPLLKDRAYRDLKDLIQSGALPEGTFLSGRQLVARLRMSKTPIRSALERLETEGRVESKKRKTARDGRPAPLDLSVVSNPAPPAELGGRDSEFAAKHRCQMTEA